MIPIDTVQCLDAYELVEGLPEASVDLLLTDAPYNTTALHWEMELDLPRWWAAVRRILKPRAACVMTASQPFTTRLIASNYEMFRYEWIWEKSNGTNFLNVNVQPFKTHENILVFSLQAAAPATPNTMTYYPQKTPGDPYTQTQGKQGLYKTHSPIKGLNITDSAGGRFPRSVLRFTEQRGLHPTQKPVALFEYLIKTYTQAGELVVDPFVGSGTTALAARNLGRRFICGDLSPEYVVIANKRLSEPYTLPLFAEVTFTEPAQAIGLWSEE